jgi:hypothetical protein
LRVFVYEHIVGGGVLAADEPIPPSLLREGAAMHRALVDDFAAVDDVRVVTTLDARFAQQHACKSSADVEFVVVDDRGGVLREFDRLSAECDWIVVVAPEIGGALAERAGRARQLGGRLLGLSDEVVAVGSDKHATAELLSRHSVPCTAGYRHTSGDVPPADLVYPALAKPCEGAGCEGIVVLRSASDWRSVRANGPTVFRAEPIVAGTPVSVTLLCGQDGAIPLLAGRQDVRIADHVTYHGGCLPCRHGEGDRAMALAERVVAALPRPLGFGLFGIDMILSDRDPGGDVVVEINPRVTTSYVALRRLAVGNLARDMLDMAAGRTPRLAFDTTAVEFTPDGRVRESSREPLTTDHTDNR